MFPSIFKHMKECKNQNQINFEEPTYARNLPHQNFETHVIFFGGQQTLGDIVESLAGAVLLDSGFNCDTVWRVFKKLLAPLATAETVPIEPTRELRELCDEYKFENRKPTKIKDDNNNVLSTVTVVVNGEEISETAWGTNGNSATKHACVQLLKTLKVWSQLSSFLPLIYITS
jgi:endoribonuclease Dicer